MNTRGLQVMLSSSNTYLKIIKEEVGSNSTVASNFETENLCGKALDFQFSVKPKQEVLDIKSEPQTSLIGEIILSEDKKDGSFNNGEIKQQKNPLYTFCSKCNGLFPYKNHRLHPNFMTLVNRVQTLSKTNPFVCDVCDTEIDTLREAGDHLDIHNETSLTCTKCTYNTNKLGDFIRHRDLEHEEDGTNPTQERDVISKENKEYYSCDVTDLQTLSDDSLRILEKKRDHANLEGLSKSRLKRLEKKGVLAGLKAHCEKSDQTGVYSLCKKCNKYWPYLNHELHEKMDKITKREISIQNPYECTECAKAVTDVKEIYHHLKLLCKTNSNAPTHVQGQARYMRCKYKTTFELDFKLHTIFMHNAAGYKNTFRPMIGKNSTHCTLCGYNGPTSERLRIHMRQAHGRKKFVCHICVFQTRTTYHLKRHIAMKHTRTYKKYDRKYICETCAKEYSKQGSLDNHLVTVHKKNLGLKTLYCHNCNFKSLTKSKLTKHIMKHVKKEQLFCANCDYKTANKTNLVQHMVKHADPSRLKMYKCTVCSFETKRPHTLRHHIKSHENLK